jgi:uncharacterized protein (TIGR02421 family)
MNIGETINTSTLLENLPVWEIFPEGIGINIEKKLPFLIINRSATKREQKIISNEPSYIWANDDVDASGLIKEVTEALADEFGAFMIIEFWINKDNYDTFYIKYPEGRAPATVEMLEEGLLHFKQQFPHLKVKHDNVAQRSPLDKKELFTKQEFKKAGILKIGVEIPNFFLDPKSGHELPVFFRKFREQFSSTLKKAIYEFIRVQTNLGLSSYKLLGRKVLNKSVWEVDKALAEIETAFEFLILIAPANSDQSWEEFKQNKFNKNPISHYRLLPVDPEKLKQRLYHINIDAVDDPLMAFIFREKREELDTLLTMLNERNSYEFMLSSIRLYKSVDENLLKIAQDILENVHPVTGSDFEKADGEYFARAAKKEIEYYQEQDPSFHTSVTTRDDMVGIMVSKGRVYIGKNFLTSKARVNPLLQHEVGTHVVTYFNGSKQPLQLLRSGLAGYDELQEGLAVISEYMVGGLTANRLRILAARVTAADDMVNGAEFKDVYNELTNKHKFGESTAYELTTRIYQSGGYTKDIIYLRGLVKLMDYLKNGGEMDNLFIGKIADKHISIIKELKDRQVLKPIALNPRYMQEEQSLARLEKVKAGIPLLELIN